VLPPFLRLGLPQGLPHKDKGVTPHKKGAFIVFFTIYDRFFRRLPVFRVVVAKSDYFSRLSIVGKAIFWDTKTENVSA